MSHIFFTKMNFNPLYLDKHYLYLLQYRLKMMQLGYNTKVCSLEWFIRNTKERLKKAYHIVFASQDDF